MNKIKIFQIGIVTVFIFLLGAYFLTLNLNVKKINAATWVPNHTDDGEIAITPVNEQITLNSYSVAFNLQSTTGSTLHTHWIFYQYFCPSTIQFDPEGPGNSGCERHLVQHDAWIDVPANHAVTIGGYTTTPQVANLQFSNCGEYQTDIHLDGYSGANVQHTYQSAGWYNTGINCSIPVPTPTLTPTVIPTATPTSVPTPTNTPTPTYVPTPTVTKYPTPTITKYPTPTYQPTATPTPTTNVNASCYFNPYVVNLNSSLYGESTLYYSTHNLQSNNKKVTVCIDVDNNLPTYISSTTIDYGNYPVSLAINGQHNYTAVMYLKNKNDSDTSCDGTIINTCNMYSVAPTIQPTSTPFTTNNNNNNQNQNQGQNQGQNQTQNNNQTQNANPTINVNNTNNNNINITQNTQTQAVLASYVGPAVTIAPEPQVKQLPNTGTPISDFAMIASLPFGLLVKRFIKLG